MPNQENPVKKSAYQRLIETGAPIDNHLSDLYIEATPDVMAVLNDIKKDDPTVMFSTFDDLRTGSVWVDLPFQYEPYWQDKQRQEERATSAPSA